MNVVEVRRRMLAKLAESNLTKKDIPRLHLRPMLSPPSGIAPAAPGFLIPYHTLTGEVNGFARYRYLAPVLSTKGKSLRYTQFAGKSPEPYFPPLLEGGDWIDYFANHKGEDCVLFITEGELKAACACKLNFPTIGLGGVWNFKSKKENFIPGLANLDWKDALVYIVYDSDAVKNFQVMQAENALAGALVERGARVYIIRLPAVGDRKVGLDDYLVANGADKFEALAAATEPWAPSRMLHEFNEKLVFVTNPGLVLKLDTHQRMGPSPFMTSIYAKYSLEMAGVNKKGESVLVKKNAAKEWIAWRHRGEVEHITYAPGAPTIMPEKNAVNLWRGWGVAPELVVPGDVSLWKKFMDYYFLNTDPGDRRWFEQWLAYPLQYPGTKLFTGVVAHSLAKGTGKSLLGHTMWKIYGENYSEIDEATLLSDFNDWAENKQFVMGEEISGGDKRALGDRIKGMITRPLIRINVKFIPKYVLPDCVNYYFNSNHPDSFYIEDEDRRLFVHELRCGRLVDRDPEFVRAYDAWYKNPVNIGHLFHYFLHLDLSGFDPLAPARETEAKRNMTELGRSEAGAWVAALKHTPAQVLRLGRSLENAEPGPTIKHTLMTSDELYAIYRSQNGTTTLTRNGLARALKSGDFRQVNRGEPVGVGDRQRPFTVRLWAVQGDRAKLEIAAPAEITKIYNAERIALPAPTKKEKF